MKRFTRTTALILGAIALCAMGKEIEDATPTPAPILTTDISGGDLVFFTGAAPQMALLARLSDLAKNRAETPEVQAEAAMVLKEQTDAVERLKALAAGKGVTVAGEPDDQGKAILKSVDALKGVKFDKSYLDALTDAEDALEPSLNAGAGSSDKEIKALATAVQGTLKQERDRVKKLGM
jgi:predicted outer membrane protein